MPVTVNANGLSVVHRGSGGMASATLPDVCKTPSPPGSPNPVPYPNIALSSDLVQGTMTVEVDGQMAAVQGSKFAKSTGDEPGVAGGVVSNVLLMDATFISFSPTVMMDGLPVCRLTDKMLMNHGNTVCLGGELQAPVLPATCPPVPEPEAPQLCDFSDLKIECGHEKRKYELATRDSPGATLQVITSSEAEELKIEFSGGCGLTHMSPGCAKVHVLDEEGKELAVENKTSVKFPLSDHSVRFATDWLAVLYGFFEPSSFPRDTYTLYGTTCNGTGTEEVVAAEYALIQVFPNASWEGEIEFSYKHDKKKGEDKRPSPSELDEQGMYELKGKVTAKVGETKLEYEAGVEGKGANRNSDPASRLLFWSTQKALSGLAHVLGSVEDHYSTKLNIQWPSLKFGGGLKLAELKKQPRVATQGSFFFEADPLIGLDVKIDILDWIIAVAAALHAGPQVAQFLLEVKHRIADKKTLMGAKQNSRLNASLDVGIVFTATGKVGGGLGWKVIQGKVTIDSDKAKISGTVGFKLEALIKGDVTVWIVKASAGTSLSMLSEDGKEPSSITGEIVAQSGKKLSCKGVIKFNGLAIYFLYYLDVGADGASGDKSAEPKPGSHAPKFSSKVGIKTQAVKESKCLCTLLEPAVLLDTGSEGVKDLL